MEKESDLSLYSSICRKGEYYYPATAHYNNINNNNNSNANFVWCDKCKKSGLISCIGWKDYDMCLKCVSEVTSQMSGNNNIIDRSKSDAYTPPIGSDDSLNYMSGNITMK